MADHLKQAWAWCLSVLAMAAGALDLNDVLAGLGIVVAVLTIVERVYTIRLKRRALAGKEP